MARLEVKENVVFAEVKESVSPYGEMMKLLKEYIDQVDSITYCDALPDEGETDHLYITRTGGAYIYEDGWVQLTGGQGFYYARVTPSDIRNSTLSANIDGFRLEDGVAVILIFDDFDGVIHGIVDINISNTGEWPIKEVSRFYPQNGTKMFVWDAQTCDWRIDDSSDGITGISVNGKAQEIIDHVVDLLIKTSDLENDSGYITDEALEGYAKETDIPTKTSDLDNDSGYITDSALEGYAKTEDIPTELSDLDNDMGYITEDALDGYALEDEIPTKVSQLENDADYTTVEATKAEIAEQIAEIVAGAPESLDTLKEIADWIEHHEDDAAAMNTAIKEAKETADNALTEAEAVKGSIPTKVSELDNDSGYITDSALDGYAKEDDIPTKVSELTNDSGFITDEALDDYAKESYVDNVQEAVDAIKDAAITGITLNGDEVPVADNTAELTIEAEAPIEHIAVNGEEQPIEDKTVDLAIDRASVDGETLVVGDTAGGGSDVLRGTIPAGETLKFSGDGIIASFCDTGYNANVFSLIDHIAIPIYSDGVTWVTYDNGVYTAFNEKDRGFDYMLIGATSIIED